MRFIEFTVPGRISTNHRVRGAIRGGRVRMYKAADYRDYMQRVRLFAQAARASVADWPMDARYEVTITMHEHDRRRRDLDNAKAIGDGLNGVLYVDDSQVDHAHQHRGEVRKTAPCVVVRVEVLP